MRAVILGAGSIGQRHLRNLVKLGQEIVAVVDPDPARLEEVRSLVPAPCLLAGDEAAALDRDADLVVICSPTHRHLDQARAALARGRHVFVEKPLSHTLDGVDVFVDEAARSGRQVMVACNLRFLPSLCRLQRLLDDGMIGRPLGARAQFGYYLPFWRPGTDYRDGYGARQATGGGIILECVHEFDYLRWLLGTPREVFAYAAKVSALEIDTEDTADVLLRFDGGLVASVHLDYLQRTYGRSCDVIGENGVLAWDYVGQTVTLFDKEGHPEVFREAAGAQPEQMYLDEMRHFLGCIENGGSPALDAAGGRAVLRMALAARASAREGRPVALAP